MAQYVVPEEKWKVMLELSDALKHAKDELVFAWEKLADDLNFVGPTVSVVDEDKGIIEASERPSDAFIRQRRLVLVVDMLKGLLPEDVELAAKLSTITSKLDLAQQLALVQEGADAADAIQAEPEPVAESEGILPEGRTMDGGVTPDNVMQLFKN